jgi:hypothetical protein
VTWGGGRTLRPQRAISFPRAVWLRVMNLSNSVLMSWNMRGWRALEECLVG